VVLLDGRDQIGQCLPDLAGRFEQPYRVGVDWPLGGLEPVSNQPSVVSQFL